VPCPAVPLRTRERLLAALRENPGGLTVAQLAALLGLKPNAMRKHLAALSALGSVAADRPPPRGAGRPPARFRLAGEDKTGHADRLLSRLFLQALGDVDASEAEQIALNSKPPRSRAASLDDTLSSLGFAPVDISSASQRAAGNRTIELRACPYLELVAQPHGQVICAFHRGLVRRDMPVGAVLRDFQIAPRGPRCRIVLTTPNQDQKGSRS
jgi:predicted ArsR family transcriptional regulator